MQLFLSTSPSYHVTWKMSQIHDTMSHFMASCKWLKYRARRRHSGNHQFTKWLSSESHKVMKCKSFLLVTVFGWASWAQTNWQASPPGWIWSPFWLWQIVAIVTSRRLAAPLEYIAALFTNLFYNYYYCPNRTHIEESILRFLMIKIDYRTIGIS